MTHPEHIDPTLAAKKCTQAELDVVHLRNHATSWTLIAHELGKSRGTIRHLWSQANRKVNGGYVPDTHDAAREKAIRALDPDVQRTKQGIPMAGTRGAIVGTTPDTITRSGKVA